MEKTQMVKQISDLVKLTLVWNFRSYSPLRSNKTTCYRTWTWQRNTWQVSTYDACQNMNTELRLIHSIASSNKHGKNAFGKQISDLVKLTLVWNFWSGSPLWSMKTICYGTWTWQIKAWHGATQRAWQNMNIELRLNHTRACSNKHGKSAKDISFTDLVKILTCQK